MENKVNRRAKKGLDFFFFLTTPNRVVELQSTFQERHHHKFTVHE